jgi:hypothetical protein
VYTVRFTDLAAGDVLQITFALHRRLGYLWGNNRQHTRARLHEWIVTPLEEDPYDAYSRERGEPSLRFRQINKGNGGDYDLAYLVDDDVRECLVVLVRIRGDQAAFYAAAVLRATRLGARYRE